MLRISSPFKFTITLIKASVKEYTSSSRVWSGDTLLKTLESVKTYHLNDAIQCIKDNSKSSQTKYGGVCFSNSFMNLSTSKIFKLKSPSWGSYCSISLGTGAY